MLTTWHRLNAWRHKSVHVVMWYSRKRRALTMTPSVITDVRAYVDGAQCRTWTLLGTILDLTLTAVLLGKMTCAIVFFKYCQSIRTCRKDRCLEYEKHKNIHVFQFCFMPSYLSLSKPTPRIQSSDAAADCNVLLQPITTISSGKIRLTSRWVFGGSNLGNCSKRVQSNNRIGNSGIECHRAVTIEVQASSLKLRTAPPFNCPQVWSLAFQLNLSRHTTISQARKAPRCSSILRFTQLIVLL